MDGRMTREEAIRELIAMKPHIESRMSIVGTDAYDMAIEALSQPPSDDWEKYSDKLWKEAYERGKAEAQQKQGKWIVYYECPKCGEITKNFTEYCPFCNADMRGEQKREQ